MDIADNFFIPDVCIYHGNCADGFGAAYAVWKRFGDEVEYIPGTYGMPLPDMTGKAVLFVDFSLKHVIMEALLEQAAGVFIIDHHKTALEDLQPLIDAKKLEGVFNMEKSGAMLTWEYYHAEEPPTLIKHIQDRDLWKFELPHTRNIQAALFSYPYDFAIWDALMHEDVDKLAADGIAIERKHFKDIKELLAVTQRSMVIGGHVVPVANLPYTMSSDAAGMLAEGQPFGACYWDTPGGRIFSLRSRQGGLDVSEIAKIYGGGGHPAAAGFPAPRNWEGDDGRVS